MVVDDPDISIFDLDEKKVVNLSYDYRNPMMDPSISFGNKPTSAMRWWFDGEFMPSYDHGWWSTYIDDPNEQGLIALYHTPVPRKYQWFRVDGEFGVFFSPESDRQDGVFYDTDTDAYYDFSETARKWWYYVR